VFTEQVTEGMKDLCKWTYCFFFLCITLYAIKRV